MSDTTPRLDLPYILPSQSQKHVTHNEALQQLDALVQLVISESRNSPPSSPAEGTCYLITASPTGDWAGKTGKIAHWQDGVWQFIAPSDGWVGWFASENQMRVRVSGSWQVPETLAGGQRPMLGINTTADAANRLAVSAAASLFSHAGNGHQMKLNKAAVADTASILFQTNWSGRAEMGLAGTDQFEFKVSADGSSWATALKILSSGAVLQPARPLVRAILNSGTSTPAAGTYTGFGTLLVNQGGFSLGSAVPSGSGNRLVVPVAGPYLVVLNTLASATGTYTVTAKLNGSTSIAMVKDSASSSYSQSATGLAMLQAGDWLALEHTGTMQFDFGLGKTELMLVML